MERSFVIGISKGSQSVIGCGLSENEAMKKASEATGFDHVEVYINPVPFAVLNFKPAKVAKKVAKKTTKRKAK